MDDQLLQVLRDDIKSVKDEQKEGFAEVLDKFNNLDCSTHVERLSVVESRISDHVNRLDKTTNGPLNGFLKDWRVVAVLVVFAFGGGTGVTKVLDVLIKLAAK